MEKLNLFNFYSSGLKESTEAPPQYHEFALMVLVGAMCGRRVYVKIGGLPLYPNFYCVLVGESGLTRKSTTIRYVRHYFNKFLEDKVQVKWTPNVSSLEGLLAYMQRDSDGETSFIHAPDEFASLLKIGQRKGTKNIISGLAELYVCPPDYGLQVKKREESIEVSKPFLSILAATTMQWLEDNLKETDIPGGFANRFIFVYGERDRIISRPPEPSDSFERILEQQLTEIWNFIQTYDSQGLELNFSEEAGKMYDNFYYETYSKLDNLGNDYQIEALKRLVPDHVLKIATVLAVSERKRQIDERVLEQAIEYARKIFEWNLKIFGEYGKDVYTRVTDKIIKVLKKKGPMTRRKLQSLIRIRDAGKYFNRALNDLVNDEIVEINIEENNKKVVKLKAETLPELIILTKKPKNTGFKPLPNSTLLGKVYKLNQNGETKYFKITEAFFKERDGNKTDYYVLGERINTDITEYIWGPIERIVLLEECQTGVM